MGLIIKILRGAYPPLPRTFSSELSALVGKCLARQPTQRPSVNELLAMPLVRSESSRFLFAEQIPPEFSHTVMHRNPAKNKPHPAAPPPVAPQPHPADPTMIGTPVSDRYQAHDARRRQDAIEQQRRV